MSKKAVSHAGIPGMGNVCAGLHFLCMCAKPTFNFITNCQDESRVAAKFNYKCCSGFTVSEVSRFCEVKQPLWHQVSHPTTTTTQSQWTKKKTRINLPRRRADAKCCVASLLKSRKRESRRVKEGCDVSLRLWRCLRIPLCPDIHPPDQHSPLPVCMLVFCLLPGWKEPLRATQHFSDPALSSHHMTRVEHTQSHDLSTTALLFQVTGAAGHDTTPCLVPCPAGLRQTHTDDRTSTYTASMTSGFTWHPPDSIHTGTQKKNTLRLYKELNSH